MGIGGEQRKKDYLLGWGIRRGLGFLKRFLMILLIRI